MQYNKVEICGINTGKLKVLSEEEKRALLERVKQGDKKASDELVKGNLRLVLSVIQRFSNRGESMDDLFQVGCVGLIKAIKNFNTELDIKFSTYAVPMIYAMRNVFLEAYIDMTIYKALYIVCDLLSTMELTEEQKEALDVLKRINLKKQIVWDKKQICEALDTWRDNHGRPPTTTNLCEEGMPGATIIQSHFDMKASVFLKLRYKDEIQEKHRVNSFGFKSDEDWIACFVEQFEKHDTPNSREYNAVKDEGTPQWLAIARHAGVTNWGDLMRVAKVSYKKNKPYCHNHVKPYVKEVHSPYLDRLEKYLKERRELDNKLYEMWMKKGK